MGSDVLFSALDFMPTILGLMDIDSEQAYDGKDLSDILFEDKENLVAYVPIWNFERGTIVRRHSWRGVITKDFTYAKTGGEDPLEMNNVLFDSNKEPNQLHNLFCDPEYKSQKLILDKLTNEYMDAVGDKFYVAEDFAKVAPKET